MYRPIQITSFNSGFGAGSKVTIRLDPIYRYHNAKLIYREGGTLADKATIKAGIDEYIVRANGDEFRKSTPTRELRRLDGYGVPFEEGVFPIHFTKPTQMVQNRAIAEATALSTGGLRTLEIEVSINSGATDPTLEVWVEIDDAKDKNGQILTPGLIERIQYRPNYNPAAAGKFLIDNIPQDQGLLEELHIEETTDGHVQKLNIELDNKIMVKDIPDVLNKLRNAENGFTDQTKCFSYLFNPSGRLEDCLALASNGRPINAFKIEPTMGAGAPINVEAIYLGPIKN
jgi:hypothetical protein